MFPTGKLVTGRVISINDDFIDLSLKKSDVQQKRLGFGDLKVDQVVKGFVKRLDSKFGVFVTLKHCGLVGLCHLSEVDDEYVKPEDLKNRFKIKDAVKARIIRLNAEKKQISLTLKPSRLEGVEESESSESEKESDDEEVEVEETKKSKKEKQSDKKSKKETKTKFLVPVDGDDSDDDAILNEARDQDEDEDESDGDNDADSDEEEQQEEEESSEEQVKPKKGKKEPKKRDLSQRILEPSGSVFDDAASDSDDENYVSKLAEQMSSAEDEDEDEEMADSDDNSAANDNEEEPMEVEEEESEKVVTKKSSKKQAKAESPAGISVGFDWNGTGDNKAKEEEESDEEDTPKQSKKTVTPAAEVNGSEDGLNTSEDFEKALFANPNSSFLWIRYMAYWITVTEIDKAREVAERALKRIEARLTEEKLNVWIAYMRVENDYGTPQHLTEVFQRACTYNDPKRVHMELIKIYIQSNNGEMANELYKTLAKKYKESKRVWLKYGLFKFKEGQHEAARNLLDRSLKSLPKRKHLEVISKFAQYEYKHGSIERGRTIFENILSTYPKRLDLWSVYIDMEVVAQAFDKARSIFERAATLSLSSKKMKFIFKKWLQFEKDHGTVKQQENVKQRAIEYVESRQK